MTGTRGPGGPVVPVLPARGHHHQPDHPAPGRPRRAVHAVGPARRPRTDPRLPADGRPDPARRAHRRRRREPGQRDRTGQEAARARPRGRRGQRRLLRHRGHRRPARSRPGPPARVAQRSPDRLELRLLPGPAGRPELGTLALRARVAEHPDLPVTNLNSPFVKPDGIGLHPRLGTYGGLPRHRRADQARARGHRARRPGPLLGDPAARREDDRRHPAHRPGRRCRRPAPAEGRLARQHRLQPSRAAPGRHHRQQVPGQGRADQRRGRPDDGATGPRWASTTTPARC